MIVKNVMSSLIGIWFICTPWVFGMSFDTTESNLCIFLGSIQLLASLLAIKKWKRKNLFNLLSILIGFSFIIMSNAFQHHMLELMAYEILGLASIMINYAVIFPQSQ
jgi:hypothetical protein